MCNLFCTAIEIVLLYISVEKWYQEFMEADDIKMEDFNHQVK